MNGADFSGSPGTRVSQLDGNRRTRRYATRRHAAERRTVPGALIAAQAVTNVWARPSQTRSRVRGNVVCVPAASAPPPAAVSRVLGFVTCSSGLPFSPFCPVAPRRSFTLRTANDGEEIALGGMVATGVRVTLNGTQVPIERDVFIALFKNFVVSNYAGVRRALDGKPLAFKEFLSFPPGGDPLPAVLRANRRRRGTGTAQD